ncbi:DegV family protein [Iamia majanohamensis]|uniref:DegV family protein n=1 Tax=Iamia majanohamensis TaxID=467976 RepID=A0AAE9Y9I3_9ACTN|nr:DegV family protein [Iamia majanohamensis]WCO67093.1 DegV family protein [Iamia majanohamensis]
MAGVRIVTDSSCDLPPAIVEELGITVVPLSIRFGEEELTDRVELSAEQFYARMADFDGLPETAAPSPGAFEAAFRAQADDGADAVVCTTLSAALSATMASAENGARALEGEVDVRVVDSRSITSGLGTIVTRAATAARDGASADEVVALIEDLRTRVHVLGGLDTLENLKKGGRIGGAQAMLGTLLSIKPVIDISTGSVEESGKVRTRRKQMVFLRDKLAEAGAVEHLTVCDGGAPDADEFAALIAEHTGGVSPRGTIGPVIGTHGGPRMIGLTWIDPA